ncbi:MAG: hypothetical protein EP336_18505 [Rhodobacteraceae bacterium]|nr:MAG: hypothetical protein EP336_18505 [Paracoccaceae bacterium]
MFAAYASAVKEVHKADQIKMILALTLGNCTTLAALEGVESDDLQGYMVNIFLARNGKLTWRKAHIRGVGKPSPRARQITV